jgi:hypothetical protein
MCLAAAGCLSVLIVKKADFGARFLDSNLGSVVIGVT